MLYQAEMSEETTGEDASIDVWERRITRSPRTTEHGDCHSCLEGTATHLVTEVSDIA